MRGCTCLKFSLTPSLINLQCDQEKPCVHCVRAGAQCVPRDLAVSSSEQINTTSRHVQTPVYQTGSPILPESSIVDLSTIVSPERV
jgi:hypothetical protein